MTQTITRLFDNYDTALQAVRALKDAGINRDRNLRLQYLAGMGLNWKLAAKIHSEMLGYRHFPEDLFTGSEERKQTLRPRMQ